MEMEIKFNPFSLIKRKGLWLFTGWAVILMTSPSVWAQSEGVQPVGADLAPVATPVAVAVADLGDGLNVTGILRERGTRKVLGDVNLFLIPQLPSGDGAALKATTDSSGKFEIQGVKVGSYKWIINRSGYDRVEKVDELSSASVERDFYLEKTTYLAYETTIVDRAKKRDEKTRSITREQFSKLAGASNDPIKAVQNLPGINRTSGFSSQIIIEGSAPQDTAYLIDQHEVPIIFHFGGLTTVVPPEAVENVDLLSSGFGSEYGRTTAGLVGVGLKSPETDRLHGMAFVDIYNAGAVIDGPVHEKGGLFLSARKSYIGAVLKTIFKDNEDFNLTVAPDFMDLTGIYEHRVTPIDRFRLVTVASQDTLEFVLPQPVDSEPELRGGFSTKTAFFRLIPQWTHHHSPRTISRWSFGLGKNWTRIDTEENFFHLNAWFLTARLELEKHLYPFWKTWIGVDNSYSWAKVELLLPKTYSAGGVFNPFSVGENRSADVNVRNRQIGMYWRNEFQIPESSWTLIPALRGEYLSATEEFFVMPRGQIKYRVSEDWTLRSSGGLYTQSPEPGETDPSYGNPDLKSPRAAHLTLGTEKDFKGGSSRGFSWSGDLFYKHFYDLVVPSFQTVTDANGNVAPENYSNDGKGRAFGLSTQLKYDFKPWSGWLSYTLSRTTRWTSSSSESVAGFDQTHNLAVVGSVELPANWQISARFRWVTGNPFTPIVGARLDADNDIYIPIRGDFYSERVDPFWQLDLRVDKKWIFDQWILSAYLDIQNALNHENIESVRYSYDYSQTSNVTGLPVIPVFGLKGEF